jgi:hypothetical protein
MPIGPAHSTGAILSFLLTLVFSFLFFDFTMGKFVFPPRQGERGQRKNKR